MSDSKDPNPFSESSGGVRIAVHAQPGAKKTEVAGIHGDALKVRVHAPPIEGRANDELIRFLADALGVPRSKVTLFRGDKSRSKVFEVAGLSIDEARSRLLK